jgi:spore germination protein GerM
MISRRLQIILTMLVFSALALGYYALRLKRRAEALQVVTLDTRPMTPPVSGLPEAVRMFVADDRDGSIREQQVSIVLPASPSSRALTLLRVLIASYLEGTSTHKLGEGTDIRGVYFVNDTLAVVDTNAEFANKHRSGALVEELTIASFVQTLSAAFPKVTQVKFLVDGKERETLAGHADLKGVYDVATVNQLVREMR